MKKIGSRFDLSIINEVRLFVNSSTLAVSIWNYCVCIYHYKSVRLCRRRIPRDPYLG